MNREAELKNDSRSSSGLTAGERVQCLACCNIIDRDALAGEIKARMEPEVVQYMDHVETALRDDVDHEVSIRPTGWQQSVCTP